VAQGGNENGVDQELAIRNIRGEPVEFADEQDRSGDLLVGEGVRPIGELSLRDGRLDDVLGQASTCRPDRLLDVALTAEVRVAGAVQLAMLIASGNRHPRCVLHATLACQALLTFAGTVSSCTCRQTPDFQPARRIQPEPGTASGDH